MAFRSRLLLHFQQNVRDVFGFAGSQTGMQKCHDCNCCAPPEHNHGLRQNNCDPFLIVFVACFVPLTWRCLCR